MDIANILTRRYAGAEWTLNGDNNNGLTWLSDPPKPTEKALSALWDDVQAEIVAEAQAKIDAKASVVAKLQALGLTVEEVEAAFGISANV